jgi:hypothetical protein
MTDIIEDPNLEWGNKEMEVAKIKLKFQTDLLLNDTDFKARFNCLTDKKVVKY